MYYKSNVAKIFWRLKMQQTRFWVYYNLWKEIVMEDSVYKIVEVVGFSETSWEDAAKVAVAAVDKSIRDMRIAEVVMMDMRLEDNRIVGYRTKLKVSFKME